MPRYEVLVSDKAADGFQKNNHICGGSAGADIFLQEEPQLEDVVLKRRRTKLSGNKRKPGLNSSLLALELIK